MAKSTSITRTTILHAAREAQAGGKFERKDHEVGLFLRCQGRTLRWSVKLTLGGKERRWDLGDATLHDPNWYRAVAREVRALCKAGQNPDDLIRRKTVADFVENEEIALESQSTTWTWDQCVDKFLAFKAANRAIETVTDYRMKLQNEKEWASLRGRRISEIDDADIQKAVDRIAARGAFTMAEGCLRVARVMFAWAAMPAQRKDSGVAKHVLEDVRRPERPQITVKNLADHDDKSEPVLPEKRELGRALAIAQSGALPFSLSLAIELTLRSVQRRTSVSSCGVDNLEGVLESEALGAEKSHLYWAAWAIPPYFMKGRKATQSSPSTLPHLVPIPADLALRLRELHRRRGSEDNWVFPAARPRRQGQSLKYPYMNPSTLSHLFLWLPDVHFSPHDVRRAFTTYGMQILGFTEPQTKLILDHTEGRDGSVLAKFYDYRQRLPEKILMMEKWNAYLDRLADEAREAEPLFFDKMALRARIEKLREKKFRKVHEAPDDLPTIKQMIGRDAVETLRSAELAMSQKPSEQQTLGEHIRTIVAETKKLNARHEAEVLEQQRKHSFSHRRRRKRDRVEQHS